MKVRDRKKQIGDFRTKHNSPNLEFTEDQKKAMTILNNLCDSDPVEHKAVISDLQNYLGFFGGEVGTNLIHEIIKNRKKDIL